MVDLIKPIVDQDMLKKISTLERENKSLKNDIKSLKEAIDLTNRKIKYIEQQHNKLKKIINNQPTI